MIPLEALCCGVPVIATDKTGHAEWFEGSGAIPVETGDLSYCSPGPGRAPSIDITSLVEALLVAWGQYDILSKGALARAPLLREQWAWSKVLKPLLELLS